MVAVDKVVGESPVVVAAELYDLRLEGRFTSSDVLLRLMEDTELMFWMQQASGTTQIQRELPVVDRVVVHLEQMSVLNPNWKQFGSKLGEELQRMVSDTNRCIVQLSSPNLFRSGGVINQLGEEIVSELNLIPMRSNSNAKDVPQCSKKRPFDDVEPSSSDECDSENESEYESDCDTSLVPGVGYRRRKEMSAAIFRYFMYADDDKQTSMGVSVGPK